MMRTSLALWHLLSEGCQVNQKTYHEVQEGGYGYLKNLGFNFSSTNSFTFISFTDFTDYSKACLQKHCCVDVAANLRNCHSPVTVKCFSSLVEYLSTSSYLWSLDHTLWPPKEVIYDWCLDRWLWLKTPLTQVCSLQCKFVAWLELAGVEAFQGKAGWCAFCHLWWKQPRLSCFSINFHT